MADFTKSERRILREIAGEVYEAEAGELLGTLEAKFREWRAGAILGSELIHEIHQFHQHDSRDLWSVYRVMREPDIVARGVASGFIPEGRVADDLLVKLAPMIGFYKPRAEEPDADEADAEDDDA